MAQRKRKSEVVDRILNTPENVRVPMEPGVAPNDNIDPATVKKWGEAFDKGKPISALFNGTYTIENTKTGNHRTIRIRTRRPDASFAPGKRTIELLMGPDNESSYKAFGFVTDEGVQMWKRNQSGAREWAKRNDFEKMSDILWGLVVLGEKSRFYQAGLRVHGSSTCIRCNRKLTTPQSIKAGIGPVCAGRE